MNYFIIPDSIDIAALLRLHRLERFTKPLFIDKFNYVISLLCKQQAFREYPSKFVESKAEYIRQVVGRRYEATIKNTLVSLGIIETNGSYQVGVRSTGYRLSKSFWHGKTRRVAVTDKKLVARIEKHRRRRFTAAAKSSVALQAIAQSLTLIELDFEAADRYVASASSLSARARETRVHQLQAIRTSKFYLHVDRQGRVHHNFVGLSNDLKRFATINRECLFAVDVGNMQPALLTLFYAHDCEEKTRYVELVRSDGFYAFFNARMSSPFNLEDELQRKKQKQLLFKRYLFCHNAIQHEIGNIFKSEFPVLADAVQMIKAGFHKRLARRLQQIESSVIIGEVIEGLAGTHPTMPLISVHDCIVTTSPFVGCAEKAMKDSFAKLLGFAVPVKSKIITELHPPHEICTVARALHPSASSRSTV